MNSDSTNLSEDRERNDEGLGFLRAHSWVAEALVRKKGIESETVNLSNRTPGTLENAVYRGLAKIEEQINVHPRLRTDDQANDAATIAEELLRKELFKLVRKGPDTFLKSYRNLLKNGARPGHEVAASGIRVMSHELGIETSLRKLAHTRVRAEAEEQERNNNASAIGWVDELVGAYGNNTNYNDARLHNALTQAFQAFSGRADETQFPSEAKGEEIREMALGYMRFLVAELLSGGKEAYKNGYIMLPTMSLKRADAEGKPQNDVVSADNDQALALVQPAARTFARELGIELPRRKDFQRSDQQRSVRSDSPGTAGRIGR